MALNIGSAAPSLELPLVSGGTFSTDSLRGRPFILTFFSTWSRTCLDDLKFLMSLRERFKGIEVVAVSFDNRSSTVASFLKKNDLSFISLIDKKQKYLDEFQILVIPTAYFIDSDGILKNMYVSFDDLIKEAMIADVDQALNPPKSDR